jgi:hypothetical protein
LHPAELQPVLNEPVLIIKEKKIIVIADLHIGIENELRERGLEAPSQTKSMTKRLIKLLEKYKPERIILLGDIKHNIPSSTFQERTDVKHFIETIEPYGTLHILPGNHDGGIKKLLKQNIFLHPSNGYAYENIGFIHGHRWPKEEIMHCKHIIIAHTHPTIMLTDRLGYKTFEPCWIKGRFIETKIKEKYPSSNKNQDVIIMPAFNPLCGGIAANKEPIIGPFGKIIDIKNAEVYLLNGTALGRIKDIK